MILPTTLSKFIWFFIKKNKKLFIVMQLLLLGWPIKNTLWPYLFKLFVDQITRYSGSKINMWHDFSTILLAWLFFWIGIEIMNRGHGVIAAKLYPKFEANIRIAMFECINNKSQDFFICSFAGNIVNKIADLVNGCTNLVVMMTAIFIPVSLAIIISLTMFVTINYMFAALLALWMILHFGICFFYLKHCITKSQTHGHSRSKLMGNIVDVITNIINVKLFVKQQYEYNNISISQQEEQEKHIAVLLALEKVKIKLGILSVLLLGIGMTWCILYCWQRNLITVAEVILIFNITWNIQLLSWIASQELPKFFKEIGICLQALTIIQPENSVLVNPIINTLKLAKGEIKFEEVTFCYENQERKLFDKFSITIHGGSKVGVVGFSGSGKSSFINIITRVFPVNSGKIYLDDIDISTVSIDELRKKIAVIPQEPILFHRSIMENIKYGNIQATDTEIIDAAKLAYCHDFICALPQGYNTIVGERGLKLSGGEKQRIAIARALLKNAPILILDEATSALDVITEKAIKSNLDLLAETRTIIIISHRFATFSNLDRIISLKDGKILEDKKTDELFNCQQEDYTAMLQLQANSLV